MVSQDLPIKMAIRVAKASRIAIADFGRRALPHNTGVVWQDWFTALYAEDVQQDALAGLTSLGYAPLIVEMRAAGKATLNLRDLQGFKQMAKSLLEALRRGAATGAPMIGIDPAFVMMLRNDYKKAGYTVPDVLLPQEFLARQIRKGGEIPKANTVKNAILLSHCTEIASLPDAGDLWVEVFSALGVKVTTPSTGCCGMAGLFGHRRRHQIVSRRLFDMSWAKHMPAENSLVVATGFSCRCQAERLSGSKLRHPLGLVAQLLIGR
jgi:Fe-S oxidoreductase